ncbi:MAG: TetR/AcrR family transcriptional regulator [Rhodospirillales bacterium]
MRQSAQPLEAEAAPKGNTRVSREDWIAAALEVLIAQGVDRVKILTLSEALSVSRSSFYWYFTDRKALLQALLEAWGEKNTRAFVESCALPAERVTGAVCNLFRCFVDDDLFDPQLDFAIREWSRRSPAVRRVVDAADAARLEAIAALFRRYGYEAQDAETRARILYFMQIGYYALELREPLALRLERVPGYLEGFTGRKSTPDEVAALSSYAQAAAKR